MDLGAGRRGVDMGPSALRLAGLDERIGALGYDVPGPGQCPGRAAGKPARARRERPLPAADRAVLHTARRDGRAGHDGRKLPLVLGGDHSVAVGTISGISKYLSRPGRQNRRDLDRCPRRHEHARQFAQRQRPRHAARLLPRRRASRTDRTSSATRRKSIRTTSPSSASATWTGERSRTSRPPAFTPSRCARSTNAACAP